MNVDEDWRARRRYMAKQGIEKLFDPELEKSINKKDFILDEALIDLEAQNAIYTT
jgi:hypothetical protein